MDGSTVVMEHLSERAGTGLRAQGTQLDIRSENACLDVEGG